MSEQLEQLARYPSKHAIEAVQRIFPGEEFDSIGRFDATKQCQIAIERATADLRREVDKLQGIISRGKGPDAIAILYSESEKLLAENDRLRSALSRIASYPVHSEPMGVALDMQDIATTALKPSQP